jgi:glycosyltransferase involved in cell wall biosynthesis
MNILIPAYEPSTRFIKLIQDLKSKCDYNIVVIDDGSWDKYSNIFRSIKELGCTVLTHATNLGKGQALKTGFKYIMENGDNTGVVCADCDGQHLPEDIIRTAEAINEHKDCIILGTRRFTGNVPLRSSLGNSITRAVFTFASGVKVYDTQTGLRGYSSDMLPWLCEVSGDRFEYEMNLLLEAVPSGYSFHEINIDTIYLEENKSSHFRAIKDSARVYFPILKFSLSSILSAILDFTLVILIQMVTSNLFTAVVGARVCSAIFNYTMNKIYVFSKFKSSTVKHSLPRYFLLATFIMFANYGVIHVYNEVIGIPLFFSKLFAEVTIFAFSFWCQRKFIFNTPTKVKDAKLD